MQGLGHESAAFELGAQCRNYALDQGRAGVLPALSLTGGLAVTDVGVGRMACDAGIFVDVGAGNLRPRFAMEVEFTNNAPVGIANRQVDLFARYENLRAVLTLKFYPSMTRAQDGRIPAVAFCLAKEDDGLVHIKRVFEMGTAPSRLQSALKRNVTNIWTRAGFVLDAGIDDRAGGFTVEPYPDDPAFMFRGGPLPIDFDDPQLRRHFTVTVLERDLFFGVSVDRPAGGAAQDLSIDLYRVLYAVYGARARLTEMTCLTMAQSTCVMSTSPLSVRDPSLSLRGSGTS
mmetsp:Transcript_15452/g.62187  ORF Transcript_15452/g.62187 Transcript_15452/m.62187 type:complete len:287 (-) Transcript_15452:184-1044(-)